MKKIFCLFLFFCLAGCADRFSLDKGRGPDPQGFVTNNPLVLPPDYLLRAPQLPETDTKVPQPEAEQDQAKQTQTPDDAQTPNPPKEETSAAEGADPT